MSDKKFIITIGREYGSGGHEIAELISKQLNIPLYDRNIIALASQASGITEERLKESDERVGNPFFEPYLLNQYDYYNISQKLFLTQCEIMKEKAEAGSAVFVGRCSDDVLQEVENAYHFFIWAPISDRISRIMKVEQLDNYFAAERLVKQTDKQRKAYYQLYTDHKWGSYTGKDMVLNSSTLGIQKTAQIIIDFVSQALL
ncbi:MAG: cytidylate kinase-like family protein [Hespellia sp.]|nr:cytidylate kinase-like family protein [Hespellia sp.]